MNPERAADRDLRADTCASCGAPAQWRLVKELTPGLSVRRCPACSVAAFDPMPSDAELLQHYEQYYLTRRTNPVELDRLVDLHEPIASWLLDRLPVRGPVRILDYGFGGGAFLACMARRGHAATGADLSRQNVRQLSEYCRSNDWPMEVVDLSRQGLETLDGRRFHLVTLFQVIEHMRQPLDLARALAELQEPGGLLYIECPNDAALLAGLKRMARFGKRRERFWGSLKYPEHLHGFNRRAIARLLLAAGYAVEAVGDYSYRDGMHQVEAAIWWPRLRDNPALMSAYGLTRSLIPPADRLMSALFGAGSGLFALGRRTARITLANGADA